MKRVLIIAYAFPPIGGVGVLRVVKFVKYLPQFGWEPIILTVDRGADFVYDESLSETLPTALQVYRARSWEPLDVTKAKRAADRLSAPSSPAGGRNRLKNSLKALYFALRVPDDKLGWLPFAIQAGKQILQEQPIDLIFATAPPYTNLLVGRALKKTSGKPLVVDYRDEWSTMQYRDTPSNVFTRWVNRRLERSVLTSTDALVTAAQPISEHLRTAELLPPALYQRTIMNGFDPEDYRREQGDETDPVARTNKKFTIVYTGSFYGERQTPYYFLQALAQLLQAQPAIRARLQVIFVGSIYPNHTRFISELGLSDLVQVCGILPHQQAIKHQLAADVLLLVVGKGAGSEVVLTGKVFEYLGAGRPILALVPPAGPAAQLIRETATGVVVDPEDIPNIQQALTQLYSAWAAGQTTYQPNASLIAQYSRPTLTGNLAAVFERFA